VSAPGSSFYHDPRWLHRIGNSGDDIQHREATANQRNINPERDFALRIASHGKRQQNSE